MKYEFNTMVGMWTDTVQNLVHFGHRRDSRAGPCREAIGWSGTLASPAHALLISPHRRIDPAYAGAELLWYLSGQRSADMIAAYAPSYKQFTNDGEAKGAYGHRWVNNPGWHQKNNDRHKSESQLDGVIQLLQDKPTTRQAVMTMWDSGDLYHAVLGDWNDIPCTVCLQYLLRDGMLHAVTYMRSNDAWLGMPYDVWCFCILQAHVARAVGAIPGTYTHCVGSMHLYERDIAKIGDIDHMVVNDRNLQYPSIATWDTDAAYHHRGEVADALSIESEARTHKRQIERSPWSGIDPRNPGPLRECARMAACKWVIGTERNDLKPVLPGIDIATRLKEGGKL